MTTPKNPFGARTSLSTPAGSVDVFRLDALSKAGVSGVDRLPYSIRVLLESMLRNLDGFIVTEEDVLGLARLEREGAGAASRSPSCPGAWCCRTSRACRASSTSRRCATR